MAHDVRIVVSCPDRTGLLAAVTARLFDLGGNLGDTSFAVLGAEAEYTCVAELPDGISVGDTQAELESLPELDGAQIAVSPFALEATRGPSAHVTHRIDVRGDDRPGLVARLAEAFAEFGANIVRMDSERLPGPAAGRYLIRFEVWIPAERADACIATVANTAESLGLSCESSAS
ncbi:MAG: ACT domain-containing protein [Alphaproteobacteria bacterium]|jgi:glycine cleavage system transcriptional repressor